MAFFERGKLFENAINSTKNASFNIWDGRYLLKRKKLK